MIQPDDVELVVLPGGFSYGDYLRVGALAKYSLVGKSIIEHAKKGKYVIGICNGFQILLEMGLLPGALIPNKHLRFICKNVFLKPENTSTPFTNRMKGRKTVSMPIAHGYGNYYIDRVGLDNIESKGMVAFKYSDRDGQANEDSNPNGSLNNIAGIINENRNILGMMPHPERASEKVLGSTDGLEIFRGLLQYS